MFKDASHIISATTLADLKFVTHLAKSKSKAGETGKEKEWKGTRFRRFVCRRGICKAMR
jgi:hypothetical protein